MGKLSRDKGKAWENAVCRMLRAIGMPAKRRLDETREGNCGDVLLAECISIQCKEGKRPSPYDALTEAMDAARPGDYSVAIIRRNQHGRTKKLDMAVMPLAEWLEIVGKLKTFGVL